MSVLCVLLGCFFVITIFVHRNGKTETVTAIDRAWLNHAAIVGTAGSV